MGACLAAFDGFDGAIILQGIQSCTFLVGYSFPFLLQRATVDGYDKVFVIERFDELDRGPSYQQIRRKVLQFDATQGSVSTSFNDNILGQSATLENIDHFAFPIARIVDVSIRRGDFRPDIDFGRGIAVL